MKLCYLPRPDSSSQSSVINQLSITKYVADYPNAYRYHKHLQTERQFGQFSEVSDW